MALSCAVWGVSGWFLGEETPQSAWHAPEDLSRASERIRRISRQMCRNRLLPVVVWAGSLVMALSGGAWAQIHSKPPFPYRRRSFDLQPGRRGPVDEHPVRAGHCPQLGHDRCPKRRPLSSSRVCTSADGWSGSAGSTRSSWTRRGHRLATYELNGRDRSRFRRHQRLTPVVALRIHRPEVRS